MTEAGIRFGDNAFGMHVPGAPIGPAARPGRQARNVQARNVQARNVHARNVHARNVHARNVHARNVRVMSLPDNACEYP